MKTPYGLQIAKHQTRLAGDLKKERDYRLSKCLTKGVRSCESPLDTSHYVYPYPSSQCLGGLGHSPVTSRAESIKKGFIDSFMLKRFKNCLLLQFLNPQNHL